ncbi:MAG: sigma-70 family RNA polymerase sigma factor [Candidatus Polarisedimenticolia bacterium]
MHQQRTLPRISGEAGPQPEKILWPERIVELAASWRAAPDGAEGERRLGDLWMLINLTLQRYARSAARRFGALDPEDIRDIAADKGLELLRRLASHQWDPGASTAAELCAFLAGVARHGVIDRLRALEREIRFRSDPPEPSGLESPDLGPAEHARAILDCARCLSQRARHAWFLRVFYDLPSADIARHPEVSSTSAGVDAMLRRCRQLMRACMARKGFDPGVIPAGTFTLLWELLAGERTGSALQRQEAG